MPAHPSFALDGRVALVTGGSRGIGRAACVALGASGARVAVSSRKLDACEGVASEIIAAGGEAIAVAGHAGRQEEIERTVAAVMRHWGRLDILVNNAATNPEFATLQDTSMASADKVFEVNLKGPWLCSRAAVAAWMGENGGSIVNVASVAGIRPDPFMGMYSASKAALINLTKSLARELGPNRIRVNAVAPGLIRTDFARVLVDTPDILARVEGMTALGRIGEPDEIAGAILWLAGDASSYVTGSVLVIDAGASI